MYFATDGTITEAFHVKDDTDLKKDGELITDLLTESELLQFVKNAEIESPPEIKFTQQELIKIFQRANDLLRKDGLREGVERFTEFSNILFIKLISEIEDEREKEGLLRRFDKRYCWDSFEGKTGDEMLDHINNTILKEFADHYKGSGDIFQKELKIKNSDTVKEIVEKLSKLELLKIDSDVKGDAFEYFLKESVTVGNDLGEYFTPRHIVKLMVKLVDPKFGDIIYDPCCGTGGFLIEVFKHIWKNCNHSKKNLKILKEKTVYGREITGTAKVAKMNMILAGDGHTNIEHIDSLKNPVKNKYDVVLTNFPFSQDTDYGKSYGFNTEDANPIFLKHIVDSLKTGKKAAVVVFQGILYDNSEVYKKIRRTLVDKCNIEGIITLHNYVFRPYTGVNTSIIVFSKGKPTKNVWFYTVNNDGFEKTASKKGRRPIKENDLQHLQEIWECKGESDKSWLVDVKTIKNNDYILNAEFYKPKNIQESKWELHKLVDITIPVKGNEVGSDSYCMPTDGGIPFLRVGDITGKGKPINTTSKKVVLVNPTDVLMSFDGTVGIVRRGMTGAISAGIRKFNSKDTSVLLNDFLFFALHGSMVKNVIDRYSKKSTIIHSGKALQHIEIPIPSIEYQKSFVEKLNIKQKQIDYIIELLHSYDKNKIDASFFTDNNMIQLDELLDGDIQNGLYKHKSFYADKGVPIIRIDNIYDGRLDTEKIKSINISDNEYKIYGLNHNDIILNRVNSEEYIGKCGIYDNRFEKCVFESNMMRFRVNEKIINPKYAIYYLSSEKGREQILSKIKRAINQVSINQQDVGSIMIPVVSLEKQQKIVSMIDTCLDTINGLKNMLSWNKQHIQNTVDLLYHNPM